MERLNNLFLEEHAACIKRTIRQYIIADLIIVKSRTDIGNRLGLSMWGHSDENDRIFLPRTISVNEQLSVIFAIMAREASNRNSRLSDHARYLLSSGSINFLNHLVLHEIAHIKNRWGQNKETDCDIWAFERLHEN